jgi:membrane-associated phospholipid phosphatase
MRYLKRNKYFVAAALLIVSAFFFDKTVMLWVKNFYALHPGLFSLSEKINSVMGFISNGGTLIAVALILLAAGWLDKRKLHEPGKALFIGLVSAGIGVQVIKHIAGRARPRLTYETVFIGPNLKGDYDSFPSGHTIMAFCLACILSRHYPRYRVVFYLFAILVGIYRIEGFNHFPSDVLVSAVLGTLVGRAFVATGEKEQPQQP